MIRPDMIPDEVVEAAARATHAKWMRQDSSCDETPIKCREEWGDMSEDRQQEWCEKTEIGIRAFLAFLWPGSPLPQTEEQTND